MKIPSKKLKNGFEMPTFGLGTWKMGGGLTRDIENDKNDIVGIKNAIDAGITHIDTAEIYGAGHTEELVSEAIKKYPREKLFIVSKVNSTHLRHDEVISACNASLSRLGTDYLDLYLIHAPNPDVSLAETMKALDELKEQGKIREIGVSNFGIENFKKAQSATQNKIVVNQIHYNLAYQDWQDVVDYCQKEDVLIMCYRPIERGIMAKKGIKILDEMCKKYKKTPSQIAINWIISQKNMVTIAKMSSGKHLEEDLDAVGWEMEKEDIERLKREFPHVEIPQSVLKFKK